MGRHLDALLKRRFQATKCATLLKLTVARIKQARNQKTTSVKKLRKEIAQLLQSGQDSHAYRLKAENLVRTQNTIGAYDLIEHYCKLVISRMQIIDTQRNCPLDVKEAVASLIFAAPRCSDLVDLPHVKDMFTTKYGKEFTAAILELRPDHGVNTQIIELLSTRPATGQTKLKLMQEIAAENNIEWKGENEFTKPPEDLPDKSGKVQPASESSQTGSRRDQASSMESMQSPKISPADSKDGEVHVGIPAGDTNLDAAIPNTGRVSSFGAQTIPAGIVIATADGWAEFVEGNVSHLTEYGQPLQASQVETVRISDSESELEFHDAVEGNVSDSKEAADSKMGYQNAVEAAVSVVALNDESTEGAHAHDSTSDPRKDNAPNAGAESPLPAEKPSSKSDEVTCTPSQRFDEDGAYLGSGRRTQYKGSASAGQVARPHVDNVSNARTDSSPSEIPSSKSDEVTRMPSPRFYEDTANFGSGRRRQYKDSASVAQAAFPHEDDVPNAGTESTRPSEKASSKSDEGIRMPSQRFYEDGANLGSGRRHYKDSASAAHAALPPEDDVPNTGTESPPPSEKASSKSDEVTRMPSQKFHKDGVYLDSGKRHYKDFASAAQVAFESAALAAEAAQAAMGLARFFDSESGSFKYSSLSNNLGAKAAATEIRKGRPEFDSRLFESNVDPKKITEEPKARPEFDSKLFESNVDLNKVTEEPKASPEFGRKLSDSGTVYLDSFPSEVFNSARKTGERNDGETTSSSGDDVGGMSNPMWDSEDVTQSKTSLAKSGSGYGYFDDAMTNPVSLWNRRVAGARLATEDKYAERPKFDDEEDVPYTYGELFGRNSLEKVNSGSGKFSASSSFSTRPQRGSSKHSSSSVCTFEEDGGEEKLRFGSGEFSASSSFSTRTQRGSSKHSSSSVGTFEEDGGEEQLRFEHSRLSEDSLAAGRGKEVFSHKPKFDDEEVNDGLPASGMGQFARVSSGHDREKADEAAAPSPVREAWRRSEAKPRWSSSSSNVAEDIQHERKKTAGHGDSRRTTWAKRRPLVSPPEGEQYDEATAASVASSRKKFAEVGEVDTKSYYSGSSSTKVAASDAAIEVAGGGGSASATTTLPPSRQAAKVANDAAAVSRRTTKAAANDAAVGALGGGGSASAAAVTLPPPRQVTKVAANDAAVEAGGDGSSSSAATVTLPSPSTQASAAAVYFPSPPSRQASAAAVTPPPPTRPPPPAPTLQSPLTPSPSSPTSALSPSFSDPVVLASTPPPPRTPLTASNSSSPVAPSRLSTAASAPPPAARDSPGAPHRHPKLPDYEDFVAHFQKLRQESRTAPSS